MMIVAWDRDRTRHFEGPSTAPAESAVAITRQVPKLPSVLLNRVIGIMMLLKGPQYNRDAPST